MSLLIKLFICLHIVLLGQNKNTGVTDMKQKNKSKKEWESCLSPIEYNILREKGTEPPGTGKYYKHSEDGTYHCVGCDVPLFDSNTKYDSGSGWPSFWVPVDSNSVSEYDDNSLNRKRIEIRCSTCDGHLGHVFEDGPKPTGLRYCINSVALDFKKRDNIKKNNHKHEKSE